MHTNIEITMSEVLEPDFDGRLVAATHTSSVITRG
jgi:hypothetical protein